MTKKIILAISILFACTFLTSSVFALTNEIGQGIKDMGNEMQSSMQKMGDSAKSAINDAKDGINNMFNSNDNMDMDMNNNDYTVSRTAANIDTNSTFGISNTVWTWLILTALAVGIVAIVWYYAKQNNMAQ